MTRKQSMLMAFVGAILVPTVIISALIVLDRSIKAASTLLAKTYPNSLTGEFLKEDEAFVIAKRAMQDCDLKNYAVLTDDRTSAPDGSHDRMSTRNSENTNRLVFQFRSANPPSDVFVHVEKKGTSAVIDVSRGK